MRYLPHSHLTQPSAFVASVTAADRCGRCLAVVNAARNVARKHHPHRDGVAVQSSVDDFAAGGLVGVAADRRADCTRVIAANCRAVLLHRERYPIDRIAAAHRRLSRKAGNDAGFALPNPAKIESRLCLSRGTGGGASGNSQDQSETENADQYLGQQRCPFKTDFQKSSDLT
jgi:hypothetical protein